METVRPTALCAALALVLGAEASHAQTTHQMEEIVVRARRPHSAASAQDIRARDYQLRPHGTTLEILNNVPGLVVAQHQGGGKAAQYLGRGFDADHGTDFALFVDDLPVNLPTHGHGQGYADLNFLIPEVVERIELYKGPYFARFGDFATGGALRLVTVDETPESYVLAEGGSFETQRYVALVSPRLRGLKTIFAGQAYFTDGPFENDQNHAAYNLFGKLTFEPSPETRASLTLDGYAADWDASGQIPLREVSRGRLDRFGAIDPSEGGKSDRQNLNFRLEHRPTDIDTFSFQLYGSRYRLRLLSNFTFFGATGRRFVRETDGTIRDTGDGPVEPGVDYIPGDGILQDDERFLGGARAAWSRAWILGEIPGQSRLGLETRFDEIDVALDRQVRRRRFFTVNDVRAAVGNASGFLETQVFATEHVRFETGLRGDVFFFDVRDRLPTQGEDPNFEAVPIDGSRTASIVSPKANLVLEPVRETSLFVNFGTGFHSNDARGVIRGGRARSTPLARAIGSEIGVRTEVVDGVDAALALWWLDLESELVFSGDGGDLEGTAGRFEPSGETRRFGVDFETRWQASERWFLDYDLSWARPRFRGTGAPVPLAPTLFMNGGVRFEWKKLSAALRLRYLDDRPADEERRVTASGYTLVDLLARYRWRNVEASVLLFNVLDRDWREAQFADPSCVLAELDVVPGCVSKPGRGVAEEPPPDNHFTPGNPFGVRAGIRVFF